MAGSRLAKQHRSNFVGTRGLRRSLSLPIDKTLMNETTKSCVPVPGTAGYGRAVEHFVDLSRALSFDVVCRDFLRFLPEPPARVLDAGAGAGQNAAALTEKGHEVVAVEPFGPFLDAARAGYPQHGVLWLNDSLPELATVPDQETGFDFILATGVWHHLSSAEQSRALERFRDLLKPGARCALSLRNGPPGLGTCVYPTCVRAILDDASGLGFETDFLIEDQPSLLPGKDDVRWSRVVLRKRREPAP